MNSASSELLRASGTSLSLEDAKRRCKALIDRVQSLRNLSSSSCRSTLLRLINSELSFLHRISLSPTRPPTFSFNIGHLEAVVHILQQPFISAVSRVCKQIPSHHTIYVDIICSFKGDPVWFLVSGRNPKYLSWYDSCNNGKDKGLRTRIGNVLEAARGSAVSVRPVSVIVFFSNGIDESILVNLRTEFGATDLGVQFDHFSCDFSNEFEGDWVNVLTRSYSQASVLGIKVEPFPVNVGVFCSGTICECEGRATQPVNGLSELKESVYLGDSFCCLVSRMKSWASLDDKAELVNFDTTALIAMVSGISNGSIQKLLARGESELRSRFKGNYEFVIAQVNSEIQNPIHTDFADIISGKRGIICERVYSEVTDIISTCGGAYEKLRADHLLKQIKLVSDCPSTRLMSLPTTRKLALKNKMTFGTGDYWHAPTLTANMAFVRAVLQTGMSLFTIEHRPQALIGD